MQIQPTNEQPIIAALHSKGQIRNYQSHFLVFLVAVKMQMCDMKI